jgi:hypothetical protein
MFTSPHTQLPKTIQKRAYGDGYQTPPRLLHFATILTNASSAAIHNFVKE